MTAAATSPPRSAPSITSTRSRAAGATLATTTWSTSSAPSGRGALVATTSSPATRMGGKKAPAGLRGAATPARDSSTHQEQAANGTWVNVTSNAPNIQGHRDANYIVSQHGGQTACPGN